MGYESITRGIIIGRKYASKQYAIDVLKELKLKFREEARDIGDFSYAQGMMVCADLIQKKIDKLKESN